MRNDTYEIVPCTYCHCVYPRGNGKSSRFTSRPEIIKIPSDVDILAKIKIWYEDDPARCIRIWRFSYSDGMVCAEIEEPTEDLSIMPTRAVFDASCSKLVETVLHKYDMLVAVKNYIGYEQENLHKYSDVRKETRGMNNRIDIVNYNQFVKDLKKIGGTISVDWSDETNTFAQPRSVIEVPTYFVDCLRVQLPTTDFDKKKPHRYHPGLDIPKVVKVDTYNDRVVKVTFSDGTFTKSVCGKNDIFDLDVGITICVMKKVMGKDGHKLYNNMIRDIHETMEKNEKKAEKEKQLKAEFKRRQRKAELKKAAKKAKARQEQIDIQKTAIVEASRAMSDTTGDDLK